MGNISLEHLDIEKINPLLEQYNDTNGLLFALTDLEGSLLSEPGKSDLSEDYYRDHPEILEEYDLFETGEADRKDKSEKYRSFSYQNGLKMFARPLVLRGQHMANLISGPFLPVPSEPESSGAQGEQTALNRKDGPGPLRDVPVVSEEKIRKTMDLLLGMILSLCELRIENKELSEPGESEIRYKQLVDTAVDAIYLIDEKGIIIDTNQQASRMLEKSRDEIVGQTVDVIDPNFPVDAFLAFWETIPYDRQQSFETSHIDKSGTTIPIEICGKKFKINGKTHYYGIARDISDRKRAQKELESQRDFLQKLIDEVPTRIFWKDRNGVYSGCNAAFVKDCGKSSPEDVIGHSDDSMAWQDDAERYSSFDNQLMESGQPKLKYEEYFVNNRGEQIVWRTSKVPLKNDAGDIIGLLGASESITEEKKAEKELRKKQYYLENAQALGKIGSWDLDVPGNELLWTDENYRIFGVPLGTPMSYDLFLKRIHPEDREYVNRKWQAAVRGEDAYDIDHRLMMEDGEVRWVREKADLEFDDAGHCVRGTGFTQDITERKLAEKKLEESHNLLNSFINNYPDDAWAKDSDGKMILTNEFASRHTFRGQDVIGKTVFDFFPRDTATRCWESEKEVLSHDESLQVEEEIPEADGIHYKTLFKFPLYDSEGKIIGLGGVAHDITERIKAEQAVKESEEKFRSIFEKSNVGIAIGSKRGDVLDVNDEYLKITGYGRKEFVGMNYARITHPEDLEKEHVLLEQLQKGERESFRMEKRLLAKNGNYLWLDTAITAQRDANGDIEKLIVMVIDIGERKKATESMSAFFEQPMNLHLIGQIDGTILNVNSGWENSLGYGIEEIRGKNIFDFIHPDDAERTLSEIGHLEKGQTTYYFENRYRHKEGGYITLAWSATFNIDDNIIYGVAKDITRQKAYHEQLEISEERYRELVDTVNSGVAIFKVINDGQSGRDYLIQELNQFALEHEKLNKDEVLGKSFKDIRPAIDDFGLIDVLRRAWKTGEAAFFPAKLYEDDKVSHYYENRIFRIPSGEIVTVYDDVTERERARLKLAENEGKLNNIIKNSTNLFYSHTAEGQLTFLSPQVREVLGYEVEECMQHWTDFISDSPVNKLAVASTKKALETGERQPTYELEMVCKDGRYITVEVREAPVSEEGKVVAMVGSLTDITERKAFQKALLQSEEDYKALAENARHIIIRHLIDGEITYANAFAIDYLGIPEDQLIGMDIKQFIDGRDREDHVDYVQQFKENGDSRFRHHFEMLYEYSPDETRYLDVVASPILKEGVPVSILVTAYDITKRKEAEAKILEQNKALLAAVRREEDINDRFNKAMEASSDGLWDWNLITNEIYYSPRWKEILGYREDELPNDFSIWETLTNPEDVERSWAMLKDVMDGNRDKFDIEFKMRHKDGHWVDILSRAEAYRNSEGTAQRVVGTHSDISKRKQDEERMRFLSAVTENMHDALLVTDLEGRIRYLNKSAERLFGYSRDEITGKKPDMFNADPGAEEMQREISEALARGEAYQGEALNRRKDGSQFICDFKLAPLKDEKGNITSYIGIQRDITEIRNLEEAAIRQERLSAIGELASGVAHDFNNALQIIMGGVDMAMGSDDPDEFKHYLESIKYSATDAASRVRKLQKFSQKSQIETTSFPIKVNALVDDVVREAKLLINQYQKKGIHIEIESEHKGLAYVEGNEGELRACLFNIIKNSAEAMPEGGKISILSDVHDHKVYISVKDSGMGMDSETQKKIFQPFYSTKGFEPGRGLGMAQVYSTIRDHRGEVYIKESRVGGGAVIECSLPLSRKPSVIEEGEAEYRGSARVLWVDDEKMIRDLVEKMLISLGHTADLAAGGSEALSYLAEGNRYDLVITDIGMPGMSGWQLAQEIKNRGYDTKVAVVTGWGAEVSEEDRTQYNVGYVLGKPLGLKALKTLIGEVLQMKERSSRA